MTGCPPIADFGPLKSISSIHPSKIHPISQVQKLQKELQEEIDLHFALANAVAQTSAPLSGSPSQIPTKAQELLSNKAVLEFIVLKLEEELIALHFLLSQERNERI
ncbi:uncharacterized protein LOC131248992 isoform X3 [Magnolia sinica]|uniref:uncharacterized protein LOC131248992 isoform X3 n=1 Tax=Magnolia sinica TaxID=86752 RepID=UPI00265B0A18|nr:uncharacterized protein LOC131248992 isoform X3 [Magnolia sinica]XP_058105512.1 uncharacterized protein LOC131248992 isoform X3 [Magnolia sinica]